MTPPLPAKAVIYENLENQENLSGTKIVTLRKDGRSSMRRSLIIMVVLFAGCQSVMLRERTVGQATTITDIYYEQVMNNIAMHAANPEALPYFSYPGAGVNTIQRTLTGNYTPGWDLVQLATLGPAVAAAKAYHYLFDKQSAEVSASSQNAETWNTVSTTDPDKIQLMKFAYEKVFGVIDPGHDQALCRILCNPHSADIPPPSPITTELQPRITNVPGFPLDYYHKVYPGWFSVGAKCDVPKDACYVGHCGKTYAWVTPNQMRDLANFTLAILDIATYQSSSTRNTTAGIIGYPSILPAPPR